MLQVRAFSSFRHDQSHVTNKMQMVLDCEDEIRNDNSVQTDRNGVESHLERIINDVAKATVKPEKP